MVFLVQLLPQEDEIISGYYDLGSAKKRRARARRGASVLSEKDKQLCADEVELDSYTKVDCYRTDSIIYV